MLKIGSMLLFTGLFAFASLAIAAFGARILIVPATSSHKQSMLPIANTLAQRGHNVTVLMITLTEEPVEANLVANVDLVIGTDDKQYLEEYVWKNATKPALDAWNFPVMKPMFIVFPWAMGSKLCNEAMQNKMEDMKRIATKGWDLIIVDNIAGTCGYVVAGMANAPYIVLSTTSILPTQEKNLNYPCPVSLGSPNWVRFDLGRFWDRVAFGFWYQIVDHITSPLVNQAIKWHAGHALPNDFSFARFEANSSLSIGTFPQALSTPHPEVPDILLAGDFTCGTENPEPLPQRYLQFITDSQSSGTIIAAFGHYMNWHTVPNETRQTFLDIWKDLRSYRIIWQYSGPTLVAPPPNVMITPWLPQTALLHHPSTRAFMSHMGMKSIVEGICARVPLLALPLAADQSYNARLVVQSRLGVLLDKRNVTKDGFVAQISKVLRSDSYRERIDTILGLMGDKPIPQNDIVAHKIEFAIRHHKHIEKLRIRGRSLGIVANWYLDLILVVACCCLAIMWSIFRITLAVIKRKI